MEMSTEIMKALGLAGAFAAVSVAAIGSSLGTGVGGISAVGAWKKCYAQNKPAAFQLIIFAGAPLSQTIYGMILMFVISGKIDAGFAAYWPLYMAIGLIGGIALGSSSFYQGKAAAGACDAFAETGKGFTNDLIILGIIETVSIFVFAFAIVLLTMVK